MSRVVFVDEFTGKKGAAPNPKKWSVYPTAPAGAVSTPSATRLDGEGNLELVVTKPTESAALWTKGLYEVKPPFRATAWVKFPDSYQVWHAFWWAAYDWAQKGELDFYENGGIKPYYQSCMHRWDSGKRINMLKERVITGFDPTKGFHRYGAQVERDHTVFLLDGDAVARIDHDPTYFDKPGHLIFSCWPNNDPAWTHELKLPAVMKVKRIEVRQ